MKTKRSIIGFLFLLAVVVLLLVLGDFLALSDIFDDYASHELLELFKIDTSSLPDWTQAKMEWTLLTVSLVLKVILMITSVFLLFRLFKRIGED